MVCVGGRGNAGSGERVFHWRWDRDSGACLTQNPGDHISAGALSWGQRCLNEIIGCKTQEYSDHANVCKYYANEAGLGLGTLGWQLVGMGCLLSLLFLTLPYVSSTSKDFTGRGPLLPTLCIVLRELKKEIVSYGGPTVGRSHSVGRHQGHQGDTREEDSRHRLCDSIQRPHSIEKDCETWRGIVHFAITQLEVTELEFSLKLPDSDSVPLLRGHGVQCCAT